MVRYDILQLLAAHPEEYVSGERISQQLNVTRAAIWKQIKALKEEGFEIEGQTKNGYRLMKMSLSLNEWALKQAVTTISLGRTIYLEVGAFFIFARTFTSIAGFPQQHFLLPASDNCQRYAIRSRNQ